MACTGMQLSAQERAAREKAAKELEEAIEKRKLKLWKKRIGGVETVGVEGWESTAAAKAGWCEGCVLRRIADKGGWKAKARLEEVGVVKGRGFVTAGHGHGH